MGQVKGKRRRPRPLHLHEKLRQIRQAYSLSQADLINRLGLIQELNPSDISAFERDSKNKWSREPSLPHLLRYARMAGVNVEVLIDDELELPDNLAPDPLHGVVRRSSKRMSKELTKTKMR